MTTESQIAVTAIQLQGAETVEVPGHGWVPLAFEADLNGQSLQFLQNFSQVRQGFARIFRKIAEDLER